MQYDAYTTTFAVTNLALLHIKHQSWVYEVGTIICYNTRFTAKLVQVQCQTHSLTQEQTSATAAAGAQL